MKGLRVTVDHDGRYITEVRANPPARVTIGRDPTSTIVVPEVAGAETLFDHYGGQFRLHPIVGMTGALSFVGYSGPYDVLDPWRTLDGRAVPIGLRERACGELHIGSWHLRFVHAPPRELTDLEGPLPALSTEDRRAGVWRCVRCHRRNEKRAKFCFGCGGDVAAFASAKWAPGSSVVFAIDGVTRSGRVVSGPVGAHRVYVVEDADGEQLAVPEALLDSVGPS